MTVTYSHFKVVILFELHFACQLRHLFAYWTRKDIFLEGVDILDQDEVLGTFQAEGMHTSQFDRV